MIRKNFFFILLMILGGISALCDLAFVVYIGVTISSVLSGLAFLPAAVGFTLGICFFLLLDRIVPHIHSDGRREGGGSLGKSAMLTLAVSMHNLPEGIAVGVVYAWLLAGASEVSAASALALAIGVGIQNFPEGAIISLPLAAEGVPKGKAFLIGMLSAAVETVGAVLAIALTSLYLPALPYLLGFAAGAMIFVVVEELIPSAALDGHTDCATVAFSLGFLIMMVLDVALG